MKYLTLLLLLTRIAVGADYVHAWTCPNLTANNPSICPMDNTTELSGFAGTPAAGNLLIIISTSWLSTAATLVACTDSSGTGIYVNGPDSSTSYKATQCARYNIPSGINVAHVQYTNARNQTVTVYEIASSLTVATIDASDIASTTSGGLQACGTISTTNANDYMIMAGTVFAGGPPTWTTPSLFTLDSQFSSGVNPSGAVGHRLALTTVSGYSPQWTVNFSANGLCSLVAWKVATVAGSSAIHHKVSGQ